MMHHILREKPGLKFLPLASAFIGPHSFGIDYSKDNLLLIPLDS